MLKYKASRNATKKKKSKQLLRLVVSYSDDTQSLASSHMVPAEGFWEVRNKMYFLDDLTDIHSVV